MVRMCCVCRKIEQKGEWLQQPYPKLQGVSHVYCPPCYEDLMDEIDRYAIRRWNKSVYTVIGSGQLPGT